MKLLDMLRQYTSKEYLEDILYFISGGRRGKGRVQYYNPDETSQLKKVLMDYHTFLSGGSIIYKPKYD